MYKIIKVQTRPNLEVQFHESQGTDQSAVQSYTRENYILTGKLLTFFSEVSEDGLTYTRTAYWSSEEAHNEFMNDPWIIENLLTPSREYMAATGVVALPYVSEIVDSI